MPWGKAAERAARKPWRRAIGGLPAAPGALAVLSAGSEHQMRPAQWAGPTRGANSALRRKEAWPPPAAQSDLEQETGRNSGG